MTNPIDNPISQAVEALESGQPEGPALAGAALAAVDHEAAVSGYVDGQWVYVPTLPEATRVLVVPFRSEASR